MKILGSDFDGTLTVGGINEAKCQIIRAWREAGNLFGIVSGRGPHYLQHLREQYPDLDMDFFAAYNGAIILDACGKVLDDTKCEEVDSVALTAFLHGAGCPFVFVNSEQSYTVRENGDALRDGECYLSDLPDHLPYFHQVSVQLESPAEAAAVTEQVRAAYGDRLNPLQNHFCIDIVAPTVNKAYGLRRVAALFGGNEADIIAVGDNINDLDMLKAFRSYAMENGVEAVKAVADETVTSVNELILLELNT
jgi:Cof subfamily protein (haloacid dehalogenase superfamily)